MPVYVHRQPVDFRKSINGLSVLVQESMELDVFSSALFVFGSRSRNKIKILYWDKTGFCFGTNGWRKTNSNGHARVMRCYHSRTSSLIGYCVGWILNNCNHTPKNISVR